MAAAERRVALVAGGSGGVGGAVCKVLARDGYDVALTYNRNREPAEAVAAAVAEAGREAAAFQLDLTDEEAVGAVVGQAAERFGRIDAAVYAAGPYIEMQYVSKLSPADLQRQLSEDTVGCFAVLAAAIPHLRETAGCAVALSTPAVRRHAKRDLLSSAPKAAVEAIVRGIAAEEGRFGVRANCVGVGVLDGGMFSRLVAEGHFDETAHQAALEILALGRLGSVEDIAEAVAFLASERAKWITGQTLEVDGGYAL